MTKSMLPKTVSVPFFFGIVDGAGNVLDENPMEMTAGFIGIEEDPRTFAMTPKNAWFITSSESEESILAAIEEERT